MNDIWPPTWEMCGALVPIDLMNFSEFGRRVDTFYPVYEALLPIRSWDRAFLAILELRA